MKIKRNPKHLSGLFLLVLLPFLLFFVTRSGATSFYNPTSFAKGNNLSTFDNKLYNYSFSYDPVYTVEEISDTHVVSLHKEDNDQFVTISVEADLGNYSQNSKDFIVKRVSDMQQSAWKDSDGKMKKTVVKDSTVNEFKNPKGTTGYEVYLVVETVDENGRVSEKGRIGPFIGFETATPNSGYPAVIAHAYGDNSKEALDALYTFADSFQLK